MSGQNMTPEQQRLLVKALLEAEPAPVVKSEPDHVCEDDGGFMYAHCKHCRRPLDH